MNRMTRQPEPHHPGGAARLILGALAWANLCLAGCSRPAPHGEAIQVVRTLGETGNQPGQFNYPRCIDSDGESLWVIDKLARVQRIDPKTGACIEGWKMPAYSNGKPTGVTVWNSTSPRAIGPVLFIPDTHEFRVMIYQTSRLHGPNVPRDSDGRPPLVASFGSYGDGPNQFVYLTDIAVLASADGTRVERLYVTEYGGNDRVSIYDAVTPWLPVEGASAPEFRFVRSFGRFGNGASAADVQFSRPQSIDVDRATRQLVITDSCNHRVGRFSLEGELIAWYGSAENPSDAPGLFKYPYGLSLPGDGSALIVEYGNNRVQRIDLASGQSLGTFGQTGRGAGQLAAPWGAAVAGGEAFVLDSGNSRVLVMEQPEGRKVLAGASSVGREGARAATTPASGGAR